MNDLTKLKWQVEYILKEKEFTRNSDKSLTIEVWMKFYSEYINNYTIRLADIYILPSSDAISRIRRHFQEKLLYIPTSLDVALKRGMRKEEWERILGYKNYTHVSDGQATFGFLNGK